jgi:integral membrane protein
MLTLYVPRHHKITNISVQHGWIKLHPLYFLKKLGEYISELKKFKIVNKIEGISYLILLFVAMPLKYYFGYPIATKIVGSIHGVLVIAFIYWLIEAKNEAGLTTKEAIRYFILSLIPFGSFYTDRELAGKLATS